MIGTVAAPYCRAEVGGSYRLERCGRNCARGLCVCYRHVDRHGTHLRAVVDDWFRAIGWRREERRLREWGPRRIKTSDWPPTSSKGAIGAADSEGLPASMATQQHGEPSEHDIT